MEPAKNRTAEDPGTLVSILSPRSKPAWAVPDIASVSRSAKQRPDLDKALTLLQSAAESLQAAEQRAQDADEYSRKLDVFHKDQMRLANDRVAAAEAKAATLAAQLDEAEEWLLKLHDRIVGHFDEVTREED